MLTSVTRWCIIITKGHSVRPAGCCKGGKMTKYIFSKILFEKNNIKDMGIEEGTITNEACEPITSILDQCMGHLNNKGLVDFEGVKFKGWLLPPLRIQPKHCIKIVVK